MEWKKISEFWLPISSFIIAVILVFIARAFVDGWVGLGYIILAMVFFIVSLLSAIFVMLNRMFKINMSWWRYLILTGFIIFLSVIILRGIAG